MKYYRILIPAVAAMLAAGCDDIAPDDRYIPVEGVKVERNVLLEDFTGQNCPNCTSAHRSIEALEEQYGEHLIAVSIHAGGFGISVDNKRYTGLMQPEGDIYCDRYGIIDFPMGVVDGKSPALSIDQWPTAVYDDISRSTPVTITLDAELDAQAGAVNIDCHAGSTEAINGNLVVWMVESSIVARQEDVNLGRIPDYVHNNVFRACVNGIDGVTVTLGPGESFEAGYTIAVRNTDTEKWNPANLAVVAFVKTASGVEQAARTQVRINEQ